jgi:hypothetical protein
MLTMQEALRINDGQLRLDSIVMSGKWVVS